MARLKSEKSVPDGSVSIKNASYSELKCSAEICRPRRSDDGRSEGDFSNSKIFFSTRRSQRSGHLRPSLSKNLIPLNSAGLCDAEITTPEWKRRARTRNAADGVLNTPASYT